MCLSSLNFLTLTPSRRLLSLLESLYIRYCSFLICRFICSFFCLPVSFFSVDHPRPPSPFLYSSVPNCGYRGSRPIFRNLKCLISLFLLSRFTNRANLTAPGYRTLFRYTAFLWDERCILFMIPDAHPCTHLYILYWCHHYGSHQVLIVALDGSWPFHGVNFLPRSSTFILYSSLPGVLCPNKIARVL